MLKIANHSHYHKQASRRLLEQLGDYALAADLLLTIEDQELEFCSDIDRQHTCFRHSFSSSRLQQRARQKNQALLKACNSKKRDIQSVLDLTAGWGKDSFILASHGQQLTMLEQNPLLHACLDYLLQVAQADSRDDVFQHLQLLRSNSLDYLQRAEGLCADCLYLDPMFPAHKSTARPGKDLQILQLLTTNLDIDELFRLALLKAGKRVVVKRPLHAPAINDNKPDLVYREKSIRFDVYLTPH
ncbi:MAG: class I SAM-dependent methyltransferase [Gammaproteobacteria bacterium]|nr:class I SAM-dependent methyltransferase [Gammaproteobacteria bacterium]